MGRKVSEPEEKPKSISEMSDYEFITKADELSSPYFRAYLVAGTRPYVAGQDNVPDFDAYRLTGGTDPRKETVVKPDKKSAKKQKLYTKKRVFPLVVITILMLVVLLTGAVGFLSADAAKFIGIYTFPDKITPAISSVDPIISIVKSVVQVDMESVYYEKFLEPNFESANTVTRICLYAVPIAALVSLLFALIGFIKGLCALFSSRQDDGYYKKFKFGFLTMAMLLSGAIFLFGGLYIAGINLVSALEFLFFKTDIMNAGYGLYILIIAPFVMWIFNLFCYKKLK